MLPVCRALYTLPCMTTCPTSWPAARTVSYSRHKDFILVLPKCSQTFALTACTSVVTQQPDCLLQVTAFERQKQTEAEKKQQAADAVKAAKEKRRTVDEESYEGIVAVENQNRGAASADARSVAEALSVLGVQEEEDKHPEK